MQQIENRSRVWLWISLSFLASYILLGVTGSLVYQGNDESGMIAIVKDGVFNSRYMHFILGWLLTSLYALGKDFFWYDLVIVIFYSAGVFRLFYLFSAYQKLSYPVITLLASCLLVGFRPFQPDFTFLSMFLPAVAIFPFIAGDKGEGLCLSRENIAISFLFIFAACLYRGHAVFLMICCAVATHLALAACEVVKKCPLSGLAHFWKRTAIMSAMAGLALFMIFTNVHFNLSFPEYARFKEFNQYRSKFTDYNNFTYDNTFKDLGISINDFSMMRAFMGIDSTPLHLENLKKLPIMPVHNIERVRNGLKETLDSLKNNSSLVLLMILLCASLFSPKARVASGACIASIVVIALVWSRMNSRVCLPFLAFAVMMSIYFIGPALEKDTLKNSRLDYFLVLYLALFLNVDFQYSAIERRVKSVNMSASVWDFCRQSNIDSVAHWVMATSNGNRVLFTSVERPGAIRIDRIGGWPGSYPQRLNKLRDVYGYDIYAGLAQPGTYHLLANYKQSRRRFETFVREHGPENAEAKVLFKTKRTVVYGVVNGSPRTR